MLKFNYESLRTFWELRDIIVKESEKVMKGSQTIDANFNLHRISLDNGKIHLTLIFRKEHIHSTDPTEYYLISVQRMTADDHFGTEFDTVYGEEALEIIAGA